MMAAVLAMGVSSCGDDDDPVLIISDEKLDFKQSEDSKNFEITSNVGWSVQTDEEWIIVSPQNGNGTADVHVKVKENNEFGEQRKGSITVTATKGSIVRTIDVSQDGIKAMLEVSPTSPSVIKGEGGTQNFQITSNLDWSVSSSDPTWLTINQNEGNGNASIIATATANGTSSSRTATLTFSGKQVNVNSVKITITQEAGGISVSPTTPSLLPEKGSTTNITVTATGRWELKGCPDWLHTSALDGVGNTTITLTTLSANDMSDEDRKATLTFTSNGMTTAIVVSQMGGCPQGLRVETSNMTIMCDGFACDLKFGPNTKGYREAFFTEAALQTMTDRDIYNKLMEQPECSGSIDITFLPTWVEPNTNIIYCVAAYGNESNSDGSHKYGPITIERITTKAETIYDDMYLTSSYNSSRWTVTAARQGNYGQRCDEFYYVAAEDDVADDYYLYANRVTYAFLAHLIFKPNIEYNKNWNYCNGPQTMNWTRTGNKFFCATWGIDRDTKKFSAELSWLYRDLTESSVREMKRVKSSPSEWNKPFRRPTQAEINKMRNSLHVIKVGK